MSCCLTLPRSTIGRDVSGEGSKMKLSRPWVKFLITVRCCGVLARRIRRCLCICVTSGGGPSGARSPISFIVVFFIWVAIASWPARVAARKGHSFVLFFPFSLVLFPLALIVAYMVGDRRKYAY